MGKSEIISHVTLDCSIMEVSEVLQQILEGRFCARTLCADFISTLSTAHPSLQSVNLDLRG